MTALAVLEDALQPLGYTVYPDRAPEVSGQYVILGGPADGRPIEEALSGDAQDSSFDLRVTAVVGTTGGVRIMLQRIRDLLSPGKQWAQFSDGTTRVSVRYERSEIVDVDLSVTFTGTNQHPAYGVDTYTLVSEEI